MTLPATAADLLSPEDRITASLVNKQKNFSHDKKVRQLQRYEHLIDNDGDKMPSLKPFTRRPGLLLQTQNIRVGCFKSSSHLEPSLCHVSLRKRKRKAPKKNFKNFSEAETGGGKVVSKKQSLNPDEVEAVPESMATESNGGWKSSSGSLREG